MVKMEWLRLVAVKASSGGGRNEYTKNEQTPVRLGGNPFQARLADVTGSMRPSRVKGRDRRGTDLLKNKKRLTKNMGERSQEVVGGQQLPNRINPRLRLCLTSGKQASVVPIQGGGG